nr:hypothetical protein [Corynebacterium lactis]
MTRPDVPAQILRDIDSLVSDIRDFATGAYLREEDRKNWEPLFSESVADEVGAALRRAAAAFAGAARDDVVKRSASVEGAASVCLAEIAEIERAQGGSIFDDELDEMLRILNSAAASIGVEGFELSTEDYFTADR